jgi:gliding motility-associated-like protein
MGDCGSTDSLTFTVTLSENPHADFTYTPLEAKAREPIQFVFTGQDAAYYLWRFGDHSAVSSDRDPTHSYMRGGVYTVHLEVANVDNNCFDTSSAQIFIEALWEAVYVPNAFSPNRDGKNELYKPVAIGIFNPVRMHIYNRWGALVFRTDDAEQVGWDGTYNGQPCPPETYTYLIEYENTLGEIKQTKGTVQLLR